MSQVVHDMFARIAKRYDLANRLLSGGRDVSWRRAALGMLQGDQHQVLDLACGTFDLGLDALAYGHASFVHASDFCAPMMHAGAEKRRGIAMSACAGDGMSLPFADNSFDVAMIAYGWRNIDQPQQCLQEFHRVLRPHGQLLILEFFKPVAWWPRFFYATYGRFILPLLGGMISGDRKAYCYLNSSIKGFLSCAQAGSALEQAGFHHLQWKGFFGGISHALVAHVSPQSD
ncbi:MAG: ubiquinone/menaquinone biosynthesis methyltransferase [Planctomycetes bacterium]|nr:ubiquinone/menaquinone biosynthesis methyltransferase [Planctomycetota bacterium]